jgi:hypothetical protein
MLPHPAGIAFRHLEKRGEAVSLAVGGSPASAHALQLARCNNPNPPYQTPNELSHDPPQLFDDNYRWPFRPQRAAIVKCASISPLPWTPSMDQKIMCATHD